MLTSGHLEDLRRSGLTDETITRAGIYSATEAGIRDVLHYAAGPGMVIPYPDLNGGPPTPGSSSTTQGPMGNGIGPRRVSRTASMCPCSSTGSSSPIPRPPCG